MSNSSMASLFLRLLFYAVVVAGVYEWLVVAAAAHDVRWLVRDDGPIEIAQLLLAAGTALLFFLLSCERAGSRELLRLLAALSLVSCARELDNFTLELGSRDAYKLMALPPVAWALWIALRARASLPAELERFARTSAFSLLLAGFLIVVVYSQILGQKELWLSLLDPSVYRPVKDMVEESSELLGYLLMFFGAIEAAMADPVE